jgi:hypothetical protein
MDDIGKRLWEIARGEGFIEPDPNDPSKEIMCAERNWVLRTLKELQEASSS